MTTYFISDLHLSATRPKTSEVFLRFLENVAAKAEGLYILGDFFEVWLGDDAADPHQMLIINAVSKLSKQGIPIYFMRGNRDFLIGEDFAKKINCTLLNDPTVIQLYDKAVVLSHGDKLCTLDKKYQFFRSVIQSRLVKKILLSLPLFYRQKIAKKLREKSPRHGPPPKTRPAFWDVVFEDVCQLLEDNKVNMLIHGHTHQPKIQDFIFKGESYKHIILGEWDKTGSVLKISPDSIELGTVA